MDEVRGLSVVTGSRLDDLVAAMASALDDGTGDPFALQLAVVPGPAHQRHVSQAVASNNGYGVCAGVEFLTVPGLRRRLHVSLAAGELPHPDDDPWATSQLARLALQVFDEVAGEAWAQPLTDHLASDGTRPGRRLATGHRVARLARSYCRDAPAMIDAWDQGRSTDADGHELDEGYRWQAKLWQRLVGKAGAAHPLAQHRDLLARLVAAPPAWLPARVHLLAVDALHPQDVELVAHLARVCQVRVWQLDHSSPVDGAVLQRLAQVHATARVGWLACADEVSSIEVPAPPPGPASMLAALQSAVRGQPVAPTAVTDGDDTIRVLPSHGPNRQVEVLRDHLCGLFEDDPTLEPRDVAVLCPNLDEFASVLDAAMVVTPTAPDAHPGHWLRTSVSHDRARQPNEVLSLLDRVLALRSGRATWQDLFDLCLSTPVATRWGFDGDGGQALKQLLAKADIRWGLDRAHRREFGINYDRGTWIAGVEALALGAALADSPLVQFKWTAPAGHLDSQASAGAGQLAEFISRIRKFFHECQPATAAVWNERLQNLISDVVEMPRAQRWQVAAARAALSRWAGPHPDATILGRADVRQVIAELSREQRTRPSFGTGAMVVTGLRDLTGIPHRVVVLLGLDDTSFPRKDRAVGDDILAGRSRPGIPHAREVDQQHLLNAIMSATERLVITYQAQDPSSLDTRDQPVAISELVQATAAAGAPLAPPVQPDGRGVLPAQAFSRGNFLSNDQGPTDADRRPFSFDRRAHRAVARLDHVGMQHTDRYPEGLLLHDFPPAPHPQVIRLQDLIAFFKHPVRSFLSQRAGLGLGSWQDEMSTAITLESDGLGFWKVKDTMVDRLRQGEDIEALIAHQKTSPLIPPTEAGVMAVERAARQAGQLATRLAQDPTPLRHHAVALDVGHPHGTIRLVGSVLARGDSHLTVQTARVKGHHVIEAWLNALALSLATGRAPRAVFEEATRTQVLTLDQRSGMGSVAAVMAEYVALYVHGHTHPLAAPPQTLWAIRERPDDLFAGRTAWQGEFDDSWGQFTSARWSAVGDRTTCSAGHDGGCSRVSIESMGSRLFGSVHLGVL
ncbi:exodeoxyribonuclease V subunit gamma [Tessaracoccus sp. SD287]|uniref:exodeoxyribonuclease V subunit gamma n=1 Tax=Tessaracoccus sp. SD287 TaxID=2782008 RepID=UPI001A96DFB5|nr:exodeoxyribonuclease V subunit gamma [Tessaracoccus sp. SD287]